MSNVFELNQPGRRSRASKIGGHVQFTDEVRKIPELHMPDHLAGMRPVAAEKIKALIERARVAVREGKLKAECPAAELITETAKGMAVRCRVEKSMVTEQDDPHSLLNFCLAPGGCQSCPTWREEKARRTVAPLVGEHEGV